MFSLGISNSTNHSRLRRVSRQHSRIIRQENRINNKNKINKNKLSISKLDNRKVFNNILKKIIEHDDTYSLKLIFSSLVNSSEESYYENKFEHFISLQKNIFINQKNNCLYEKYMNYFTRTQKLYYALNKFAYIWKVKKYKIGANTDMYMNELKEKDKNVVSILQNDRKYLFTLFDLNRIIHKCLGEANDFYSTPIPCKNPFTNIAFTKCDLYNIYFSIKKSNIEVSELFYYYFRTDFSIRHFIDKYETILRDYNIKNYCATDDDNEMYESIDEMIYHYNKKHKYNKISIDSRFPRNILISTFKPYLIYYYKSIYSLSNNTRHENALFVNSLLYNFTIKNPKFGKKRKVENMFGFTIVYESKTNDFEAPINYQKNLSNSHIKNANNYSNIVNNYIKYEDRISNNEPTQRNFETLSNMLRHNINTNFSSGHQLFETPNLNQHIYFDNDINEPPIQIINNNNNNNNSNNNNNNNNTEQNTIVLEEDSSDTNSVNTNLTEVITGSINDIEGGEQNLENNDENEISNWYFGDTEETEEKEETDSMS